MGSIRAAAISRTIGGKEVVVAVLEAATESELQSLADRWVPCGGRLVAMEAGQTADDNTLQGLTKSGED